MITESADFHHFFFFYICVVKGDSQESEHRRLRSWCSPNQRSCELSHHPATSPHNGKTSTLACQHATSLRAGCAGGHRWPCSQVHHQPPSAFRSVLHHVCACRECTLSHPPAKVWEEEHLRFRPFSRLDSVHTHTWITISKRKVKLNIFQLKY